MTMISGAEYLGLQTYKATIQLLDDDNQIAEEVAVDVRTRMIPDDIRWMPFVFNKAVQHFKPELGFTVRVVSFEETTDWI